MAPSAFGCSPAGQVPRGLLGWESAGGHEQALWAGAGVGGLYPSGLEADQTSRLYHCHHAGETVSEQHPTVCADKVATKIEV